MQKMVPEQRIDVVRRAWLALLVGACVLLPALPSAADRVTVKGATLQGAVVRVTSTHLVFETIYGKGRLEIALADVESLETEGPHRVLYADDAETQGPLAGIEDDALLVGDEPPTAERIPLADVAWSVSARRYEESLRERLRARWRYWTGSFDLGFDMERASSDTLDLDTGLTLQRSKGRNGFLFRTRYSFEKNRDRGMPSRKTTNEITGLVRLTRDLTDRTYAWGSTDAEYDEAESLGLRLVPQFGLGYFLVRREALELSVESGPGYVYERFFGGDTNEYPTVQIGGRSRADLGFAIWETEFGYLPALDDWVQDYLIRGESRLSVPITDLVAFTTTLINTYDNTPSKGEDHNEFEAILGISLGF